jgi:large subunit ribosomal protein L21
MYAIINDRGHQYKVREGDQVRVDLLDAEAGAAVTFDQVLLVELDGQQRIGTPHVAGARVTGTLCEHVKDRKVIAIRRIKTNKHVVRRGHRAQYSLVKIDKIEI